MQYALLIYDDEQRLAGMSQDEGNALMGAYGAYSEELQSTGAMKGGEALQSTQTATTVRVRDGEAITTDGPFAETKEALGGFYLIDVDSLDEALEWAAKIPSADKGSVEVRPLRVFPEAGA